MQQGTVVKGEAAKGAEMKHGPPIVLHGTGSFANASGSAQGNGVANQMSQTTTVRVEGYISY